MNIALPFAVVIASLHLTAALLFFGRRKADYSHLVNTISEVGEIESPDEIPVGYGVFLPVGLLLLMVAFFSLEMNQELAALAGSIGVGYVAAAFFPCDRNSPLIGSWRQTVHNIGGAVEYGGGGVALLWLASNLGQPFLAGGILVLLVLIGLALLPARWYRGAVQRVGELVLFGLLAYGLWMI